MGWWPFTAADPRRSGDAIPTRAERRRCWAARDAYFACLDAHAIVDATKNPAAARAACPAADADFERDCSAAWVRYFKQWRVADVQRRRRLDELHRQGAQELNVQTSFAEDGDPVEASKVKGSEDVQELLERRRAK